MSLLVRSTVGTPELGLSGWNRIDHPWAMGDLRERVPGHALIDELLHQWDRGAIRVDERSNAVVIDDEARGWYWGVLGERRVATTLSELGDDWTVIHSVPVGRGTSDIDHIVIGQAGVFTINTKYSPGKKVWSAGFGMRVDGFKQHYVGNSAKEVERASELLSHATGLTVPVCGVIAFVDPGEMVRKPATGADPGVRVVRQTELLGTLQGRPIFSVEQVERIAAEAVKPDTWRNPALPSTLGSHISREFQALEDAVGHELNQRPTSRALKSRTNRVYATHSQRRPSRPTRTVTSRPPRQHANTGRKRRQSPLEKLIGSLIFPVTGLIVAYVYLNSLAGR